MSSVNIKVHHVTRVEGHGNILVNATDGKLEEVRWEVPESPRLFEAMFRGRHYNDVQHIASRICGICSIAHSTASLHASEAALGVQVSEQTRILRKLLFNAEVLESHVLHAYCLAAPDFLGVGSVIPLIDTHKEVVVRAMKLKRLAYHMADLLAGRKTHPISCIVGGFAVLPDLEKLAAVRDAFIDALDDFDATVELFKTITVPDFERETEYIALKDPNEYAFISGDIASSDAGIVSIDEYRSVTNEFCVPHSTAKYTKNKREAYQVGALARFNLNHEQLLPRAKEAAAELKLKAPCHNPFMITIAQVVEVVHAAEDIIQETFVQVHLAANSFDPARSLRPWLYTIAANKARDLLRSRGRRQHYSLDTTGPDDDGPAPSQKLEAADTPVPDLVDADERKAAVRQLVGRMPEHLRLILTLGYFQQLPYAEIAKILDIPVGTVKSRLHAAVNHFAKLWRERIEAGSQTEP